MATGKTLARALGVDFTIPVQQSLIQERGTDLLHELALTCPCVGGDAMAGGLDAGQQRRARPNCPRCQASGWLYRQPTTIRGLVTGITSQRELLDAGIAMPGDLVLSPELEVVVSGWDKITALWAQPLDGGQPIVRGAGTHGENARLQHGMSTDEDRLWYEPADAIWCEDYDRLDAAGQPVTYQQGGDFDLGPGRVIRWLTTNRPTVLTRYVLKYRAYFEWVAFVPPQERYDRDSLSLGQKVLLRRRHVAFQNEAPVVTGPDRVPLQERVKC